MQRKPAHSRPSRFPAVELKLFAAELDGPLERRRIRLFARSLGPAYSSAYYGGVVYHDFAGMRLHRERMVIEYRHGDAIGYFDRQQVVDGVGLYLDGELVFAGGDDDPARVVAQRQDAGVPYEASITTGADEVLEEVPAGRTGVVNGLEVEGPCTIVREWELRGVGVCPYGADSATAAMFSSGDGVDVLSLQNPERGVVTRGGDGPGMDIAPTAAAGAPTAPTTPAQATAPAPVPAPALEATPEEQQQPAAPPAAPAPVDTSTPAPVEEPKPEQLAADPGRQQAIQELSQFATTFDPAEGPGAGARYFSAGLSFTDALRRSHAVLTQQNQQLRQQLSGATAVAHEGGGLGDGDAGKFAAAGGAQRQRKVVNIVGA